MDWDLPQQGIHIFTGSNLTFESVSMYNSTLVFLGTDIWFYKRNIIKAEKNENEQLPALIFTNPNVVFDIDNEWRQYPDVIEGAIYCAGKVILDDGTISGPIISRTAVVTEDFNFTDEQHPEFYTFNTGFGLYESYDWPKVIINWDERWVD